jgi:hypothetical protein
MAIEVSRHMVIPEIDLSACSPVSIVDRINDVPALKTSAGESPAFLPFFPIPARLLGARGTNEACMYELFTCSWSENGTGAETKLFFSPP